MKKALISVSLFFASPVFACSVTPMGFYEWTFNAVTTALASDSSVSFHELDSIMKSSDDSNYQVVLKDMDGKFSVRNYKVRQKAGSFCGGYEAVLEK